MKIFIKKFGEIFYKVKYRDGYKITRFLCFRFNKYINTKIDLLRNQHILNEINEKLDIFQNIVIPAISAHSKVFPKYKNIHNGKDVVICGSAPSLNKYKPIKDAIHIGVNNTYKNEKLKLDYLFVQDGGTIIEPAEDKILLYRDDKCKKFFGHHYMKLENVDNLFIAQNHYEKANAEEYYFISHSSDTKYSLCSPDISIRPLNTWGSTIFPALEFALWTHPKRIYLVGIDCSKTGYFTPQNSPINTTEDGYKHMYYGWKQIKKYIRGHYPDIEIISVNPVGLKGLFNDIYTEEDK